MNAAVRTDWSSLGSRPAYSPPRPSVLRMSSTARRDDLYLCVAACWGVSGYESGHCA
jgi:hypothetical protein